MLANAFIGRESAPDESALAKELGPVKAVWDRLLAELKREHGLDAGEWNSSSRKSGWAFRLKRGERNVVYLAPGRGAFLASFALGDRAVAAARESELPREVMEVIESARRYAEGTAVRLEVRTAKDVAAVVKLAGIKLAH